MFYQNTPNSIKISDINSYNNPYIYKLNHPNIFHLIRKNLTNLKRNQVIIKNKSVKFNNLFNWNKPIFFLKKNRLTFLYYFFLKKNIKSLSTIFSNLKRYNPENIYSFFFKTLGFLIGIFLHNDISTLIYLNGSLVRENWVLVNDFSFVQLKHNLRFYKSRFFYNKSSAIKFNTTSFNSKFLYFKGLHDHRSNILFVQSNNLLSNNNLFNFDNISIYNWKIII